MNFVYGIICHKLTNPLIFLVKELLQSPNSIILIHVDKKSNIANIRDNLPVSKNLHFIKNRVDVRWGGYSQIQATLNLLNKAQNFDYKYFSLLSGDDVPLLLINEIEDFLINNDFEYLSIDRENLNSPQHTINRLKYKYPEVFFSKDKDFKLKIICRYYSLLFKFGFRKNDLKELPKIYKGANWFTLSQHAIIYIIEYLEKNPNYNSLYKHSLCADEIYFHTIICNSHFINKIDNKLNALRYIDWKSGPDYPRTLNESDFDKMKKSEMLFARKMDSNISFKILEKLIENKEPE